MKSESRRDRIERRLRAIHDEHPKPLTFDWCRGCAIAREAGPWSVGSHYRAEHKRMGGMAA